MELAERKEKKQKELDALALKHRKLMEHIDGLKQKSLVLDQEICELTEKRAALQSTQAANKVADEFEQYKKAFRPERSFLEKPEPVSAESAESSIPIPESLPDEAPGEPPEMPEEKLQEDSSGQGLGTDAPGPEQMPVSILPAKYVMDQAELLELVRSISQGGQGGPEEIVVRNVSAGAKMLEIFHDAARIFLKAAIFSLLMLLLSLAVTVLANAGLRNTLLEFIRNAGV